MKRALLGILILASTLVGCGPAPANNASSAPAAATASAQTGRVVIQDYASCTVTYTPNGTTYVMIDTSSVENIIPPRCATSGNPGPGTTCSQQVVNLEYQVANYCASLVGTYEHITP